MHDTHPVCWQCRINLCDAGFALMLPVGTIGGMDPLLADNCLVIRDNL